MGVFDFIAPVYGLFFNMQRRSFREVLERFSEDIDFDSRKRILDVGCGTGALISVLSEGRRTVWGIDGSEKMLQIAKRKLAGKDIELFYGNAAKELPFKDKSFDMAIASYVAHGMVREDRIAMYKEMKKVTEGIVVIHDYNGVRSLMTSVIETLEGGDYFGFIKDPEGEMREVFSSVRVLDAGKRSAWYVCIP
jgi:ubiquinone/menaquinone biosynthesis C-methylase UbiE